jgi:GDP-D-mannose dehydratase
MRHDITFPLYVEVDRIFNLACPASPVHYQHDPVQTTKTSVHGAINMLGLAKRVKARILQASTSEVMETQRFTHRLRATGAASTPSAFAVATMKASVARKPCSSTTSDSTACRSRLFVSSTPMAPACTRRTAAWSAISLCRR